MRFLQLTAVVRDIRTATMVARPFFRSPVTVGRRDSNLLRLDASAVSRHHGAFLFSKHGLQYVDLFSANGSYVDGRRVDPDSAVDIRDSSVITIGPFQIIVHLDLVALPVPPSEPDATTLIVRELAATASSDAQSVGTASLAPREVLQRLLSRLAPAYVVARAGDVLWVLADLIVRFRGAGNATGSPFVSSTDRSEIVAYMLDPDAGRERATEIRAVLTDMLRFPLTLVSRETS
jgi:hypothetical protein